MSSDSLLNKEEEEEAMHTELAKVSKDQIALSSSYDPLNL